MLPVHIFCEEPKTQFPKGPEFQVMVVHCPDAIVEGFALMLNQQLEQLDDVDVPVVPPVEVPPP